MKSWNSMLFAAGLAAVFAVGCVEVKGPKEVRVGGGPVYRDDGEYYKDDEVVIYDDDQPRHHHRRHHKKVDKDYAYDLAKQIAYDNGANPGDYKIKDKKIEGTYWILFEHKHRGFGGGWRRHFTVHVAPDGEATLMMGRRLGRAKGFGEKMVIEEWDDGEPEYERKERKVEKDEAYGIAYDVARRHGRGRAGYEVHDKEIDDNRWVLFENLSHRQGSFAVRVGKYGRIDAYGL